MIKQFVQRKGLNKRTFILYADKIVVEEKGIRKNKKEEIPLHKINSDIKHEAEPPIHSKLEIYIFVILVIFSIVFLLKGVGGTEKREYLISLIFVSLLVGIFSIENIKDEIVFSGIRFYRTIPNEKAVQDFIELVTTTAKEFCQKNNLIFKEYKTDNEIELIKEFKQRTGLLSQKFILYKDRLIIESKKGLRKNAQQIPLDYIDYSLSYELQNPKVKKRLLYGVGILSIVFTTGILLEKPFNPIMLGVCITFFGSLLWVSKKSILDDNIILSSTYPIYFLKVVATEKEVMEFIELTIKTSKQYNREKYLNIELYNTKEEFVKKLNQLQNLGVISDSEYSLYRDAYDQKIWL